jgi:hypothetical protein
MHENTSGKQCGTKAVLLSKRILIIPLQRNAYRLKVGIWCTFLSRGVFEYT